MADKTAHQWLQKDASEKGSNKILFLHLLNFLNDPTVEYSRNAGQRNTSKTSA